MQTSVQRAPGRTKSTSKEELGRIGLELFIERGFDVVTVDDIARAAGIGRRTFFRYFPSKNDVPWGDFETLLAAFNSRLAGAGEVPIIDAIRVAVRTFNEVPASEMWNHRHRMRILLTTPELVAHSTVRYAAWRQIIAGYVSLRLGVERSTSVPQAVAWACLGVSLAAYEEWISDDASDLLGLIDKSFRALSTIFSGGSLAVEEEL